MITVLKTIMFKVIRKTKFIQFQPYILYFTNENTFKTQTRKIRQF